MLTATKCESARSLRDQAGVTGVQSSHCRNKADPSLAVTNGRKMLADFRNCPDDNEAHFPDCPCGKRPVRTSSMKACVASTMVFASCAY